MNAAQFSRGLGWFSIGLGAAELFAPRQLARAIGLSDSHDGLIRALGIREISSGLGLLGRPKPTGFAWSRVAGDIMDLSLLGAAANNAKSQPLSVSGSNDDDRRRLNMAIAAVAGVTVVDLITSVMLTRKPKPDPRWRFSPPGGRGGLRRPLEVDQPRYIRVDEQPTERVGRRTRESMTETPQEESTEPSVTTAPEPPPRSI